MADPYDPPPRHRDRSGAVMRFVVIAALLGVAVWGYTSFSNSEGPGLTAPVEEEQVADAGYAVTLEPIPEGATEAAPANAPAPSPAPHTTPAPSAEPVPPPSTTIGTP